MLTPVILITTLVASASACASHDNYLPVWLLERQSPPAPQADWAYETSFNWGRLDPGQLENSISASSEPDLNVVSLG